MILGTEIQLFISRTKDGDHAEQVAMREISKWLQNNLTGQTAISLTTMATYSPCLECQSAILDMLVDWRERLTVSYKLRIGYLYHKEASKRLSDKQVIEKLADWKWKIKDSRVEFTLEAISVCDELSDHEPRQVKCDSCKQQQSTEACSECETSTQRTKSKRKKEDSAIACHVHDINSSLRQIKMDEYIVPIRRESDLC